MKTILALDIATNTGWAYRGVDGTVSAGCWCLQKSEDTTKAAKLRKDRTLDARVPTLYHQLREFWNTHQIEKGHHNPVDFLVFEDVPFSTYTKQTQLWSSLRAAVWLFCYNYNVARDCCPVSTLKLFATGHGNAPKLAMVEAATKAFPGLDFKLDDNAADAIHLLRWAIILTKHSK